MSERKPSARAAEAAVHRWQPPVWDAVETGAASTPELTAHEPLAASSLEQLQREAYEEAYALGMQEGRAAGRDQSTAEIARWRALVEALHQPLGAVDAAVEQALARLVQMLVRQILERELREAPATVLGWIKAGVAALPATTGALEIRLHPADADRVREAMADQPQWRLVEDERLATGACRIEGADALIDVGLDARLAAAFAHVFDASGAHPRTDMERSDGA